VSGITLIAVCKHRRNAPTGGKPRTTLSSLPSDALIAPIELPGTGMEQTPPHPGHAPRDQLVQSRLTTPPPSDPHHSIASLRGRGDWWARLRVRLRVGLLVGRGHGRSSVWSRVNSALGRRSPGRRGTLHMRQLACPTEADSQGRRQVALLDLGRGPAQFLRASAPVRYGLRLAA
jgi:hypothetical protein